MRKKRITASIAVFLIGVSSAYSETYTLSTIADFQKADLQNSMITMDDDGEIIQNCYLDPVSLTLTSKSLPQELFNHAACAFADTIVVAGGFGLTNYSDSVYLNTIQDHDLTDWRSGPKLPETVRDHKIAKAGDGLLANVSL